jgi:hypothetical protein
MTMILFMSQNGSKSTCSPEHLFIFIEIDVSPIYWTFHQVNGRIYENFELVRANKNFFFSFERTKSLKNCIELLPWFTKGSSRKSINKQLIMQSRFYLLLRKEMFKLVDIFLKFFDG